MVRKTYFKTVLRLFKSSILRFAAIASLIAISTAVVAGIGALAPRMRQSLDLLRGEGRLRDAAYTEVMADKIEKISYAFPVFFTAVVALVVFITISRLAESQRAQIGCYKTLGYGRAAVLMKYVLFTASACVLGCGAGLLAGHFILSPVLFSIIKSDINLPDTKNLFPFFGLAAAAVMSVFVIAVTSAIVLRALREKPAALFLAKAPKTGGKVLLERMPLLWNRLSFKYKSTVRNIFRYKVRFAMTVFSVLGSTALVFSGLALFFSLSQTNAELKDTMKPISALLIISAVLLDTIVIYNITNINIEERKREIATLRVLGYRNIEVAGYIFRELFLLVLTGAALGLPAGYGFMKFLFSFLDFGGAEYIKWYVWIMAGVLSLASLTAAVLLLFRKIRKIDMNGSLKTIE